MLDFILFLPQKKEILSPLFLKNEDPFSSYPERNAPTRIFCGTRQRVQASTLVNRFYFGEHLLTALVETKELHGKIFRETIFCCKIFHLGLTWAFAFPISRVALPEAHVGCVAWLTAPLCSATPQPQPPDNGTGIPCAPCRAAPSAPTRRRRGRRRLRLVPWPYKSGEA
jgi:hypothetical protein